VFLGEPNSQAAMLGGQHPILFSTPTG
jgi:hypothetical protein